MDLNLTRMTRHIYKCVDCNKNAFYGNVDDDIPKKCAFCASPDMINIFRIDGMRRRHMKRNAVWNTYKKYLLPILTKPARGKYQKISKALIEALQAVAITEFKDENDEEKALGKCFSRDAKFTCEILDIVTEIQVAYTRIHWCNRTKYGYSADVHRMNLMNNQ